MEMLKTKELLKNMISLYEIKSKEFWKDILEGEKTLSDKEAEEILKTVHTIRKEIGFR